MPAFKGKFTKAAMDTDFGDFIEEHTGQKVRLDLQWDRAAFDGASEKDFQFFVLFESCGEALEKGEKPSIYNCSGTEYNVPKLEGKALITEEGGVYRLRGIFQPSERTGPLQGLFAVELAPAT